MTCARRGSWSVCIVWLCRADPGEGSQAIAPRQLRNFNIAHSNWQHTPRSWGINKDGRMIHSSESVMKFLTYTCHWMKPSDDQTAEISAKMLATRQTQSDWSHICTSQNLFGSSAIIIQWMLLSFVSYTYIYVLAPHHENIVYDIRFSMWMVTLIVWHIL